MPDRRIDFPMTPQLEGFCARWGVTELALFGSVANGTAGVESDVDLLVTFSPEAEWTLLDHERMRQELVGLLGRKVDLISRRAIERSRNRIRRDAILSSAVVIHAA